MTSWRGVADSGPLPGTVVRVLRTSLGWVLGALAPGSVVLGLLGDLLTWLLASERVMSVPGTILLVWAGIWTRTVAVARR